MFVRIAYNKRRPHMMIYTVHQQIEKHISVDTPPLNYNLITCHAGI